MHRPRLWRRSLWRALSVRVALPGQQRSKWCGQDSNQHGAQREGGVRASAGDEVAAGVLSQGCTSTCREYAASNARTHPTLKKLQQNEGQSHRIVSLIAEAVTNGRGTSRLTTMRSGCASHNPFIQPGNAHKPQSTNRTRRRQRAVSQAVERVRSECSARFEGPFARRRGACLPLTANGRGRPVKAMLRHRRRREVESRGSSRRRT